MVNQADDRLLYLRRHEVAQALAQVDPVEVAASTSRAHARGQVVLPDEAYLGWQTPRGHQARSLSMPGMLTTDAVAGVKIINASLGNVAAGLPRADGLTLLFDVETARPVALLDAALVSATRTAAVSTLAVRTFAPSPPRHVALVGCGRQARAHLDLLLRNFPSIERVVVHDARAEAQQAFLADEEGTAAEHGVTLLAAPAPQAALEGADTVVFVTTVTEGYVPAAWLREDAVVVHVSLDDLLPEVVLQAGLVVVDDWGLVSADHRRLLGRMVREGLLCGPGERPGPGVRRVDGEIGAYLEGGVPQRPGPTVVNPFGMAVHDVALASKVLEAAERAGLGTALPR